MTLPDNNIAVDPAAPQQGIFSVAGGINQGLLGKLQELQQGIDFGKVDGNMQIPGRLKDKPKGGMVPRGNFPINEVSRSTFEDKIAPFMDHKQEIIDKISGRGKDKTVEDGTGPKSRLDRLENRIEKKEAKIDKSAARQDAILQMQEQRAAKMLERSGNEEAYERRIAGLEDRRNELNERIRGRRDAIVQRYEDAVARVAKRRGTEIA